MIFIRPKLFISQCIEGKPVRYNGQTVKSEIVSKIMKYSDVFTECPEVAVGLGIPRKPVRLVAKDKKGDEVLLIQPDTGKDITKKMKLFSNEYLNNLPEVDGFILKAKSPSSGFAGIKVYHSADARSVLHKKGKGIFGEVVLKKFPHTAIEDEGRLNDDKIRGVFLKRVFLNAELRNIKKSKSMKRLVNFHTKNKYLFMCFSVKYLKILGNIAANPVKNDFGIIINEYKKFMNELFSVNYKYTSVVNAFMHIMGYFKNELNAAEKKNFLKNLEKYKEGRVSEKIILELLKSFAIRTNNEYILNQSIFEPYPEDLG